MGAMRRIANHINELKPAIMMMIVQATPAAVEIFYKLADNDGMSLHALIAYRFIFCTLLTVPAPLILERNKRQKQLTWRVVFQAFACGLFFMGAMGRIANIIVELKIAIIMVAVQALTAGVVIFYKLAANDGMSLPVFVAYRFIFATLFIVPVAHILERNKRQKQLTWMVVFQAFVAGLLTGSMPQNLFAQCLVFTSATFATAMLNLIPAVLYILTVCFRLERLSLGTRAGKAKVAGTVTCVGGAMLLSFYKGPNIKIWSTTVDLLHKGHGQVATSHHTHFALGAVLNLLICLSNAGGFILQAKMLRDYPYPCSANALMMFMGAIQSTVFALCMERSDWKQWRLGWNIRLLAATFSGIVGGGVAFTLTVLCVKLKGPLYVSIFSPLLLLIVAVVGSLILNEMLHLGIVLGGVLIVSGLYVFLWGKEKELKKISQSTLPKSSEDQCESIGITTTLSTKNNNNFSKNGVPVASNDGSRQEVDMHEEQC